MITLTRKNPDLDITKLVEKGSFLKEENLTSQVDTCKFRIKKYGTRSYMPAVGEEIEILDGASKIFGGNIVKVSKKKVGNNIAVYDVNVKDFTHLLDRKLVTTDYTDKSPEYIINDILTNYTDGTFTVSSMNLSYITRIDSPHSGLWQPESPMS